MGTGNWNRQIESSHLENDIRIFQIEEICPEN